jgi:hypothetical protein
MKFGVAAGNRRQQSASLGSGPFGRPRAIGELGPSQGRRSERPFPHWRHQSLAPGRRRVTLPGMDNSRRIAFSAKRLTLSHGHALVRAVIEFRHAKRPASRSSRFWRVAFRVCVAIAAPFILVGIFLAGALLGWPVMLVSIGVLVGLCLWRERRMPERAPEEPIDFRRALANGLVWAILLPVLLGMSLGLTWVFETFGTTAFFVCVAAIILFCIWLEHRAPVHMGGDWLSDGLIGHSTQSLPPSGTPQIGRASTVIAPSRPGTVARR